MWLITKILLSTCHVSIITLRDGYPWSIIRNFPLKQPSQGCWAKKTGWRIRSSQPALVLSCTTCTSKAVSTERRSSLPLPSVYTLHVFTLFVHIKYMHVCLPMEKYLYIYMFSDLRNEDVTFMIYFTIILNNSQKILESLDFLLCCIHC